jgi:hypothetical protein
LNVFEDFKDKKAKDKQLFVISYDQEKAYDSVQAYTIKASLERFNLPEHFIKFVLSGLEGATSCFKTFYGLTEDFKVETSVRQGDPLSPLIYIFVVDALHEGWINNPLYHRKTGYCFSNDQTLRIASTGYADDAMIYAETWEHIWAMNMWTREFCRAHGFRISQKTKYFISDCKGPGDPRWLPTVDGEEKFYPKPPDTEFRYLGVFMSLNLTSTTHIEYMTKTINTWKWKARTEQVDPAQLTTTVTELLLPKLELGLLYAYGITEQMCNRWTNTIIQTIFQDAHMGKMTTKLLPKDAFTSLTGIPRLWERLKTLRITEFFVATNSKTVAMVVLPSPGFVLFRKNVQTNYYR